MYKRQLYATGQGANPEYVLNYLLTENGVDPAEVDIQWKTADEVSALMVSGEARLCMMPVPAATAIQMSNPDVREALDLSAEWDGLNNGSHLDVYKRQASGRRCGRSGSGVCPAAWG